MSELIKVAIIAVSLALDVFAVCVGVGIRGHSNAEKTRIGFAFAGAEVMMNLIGAGIGRVIGNLIGGVAAYLGFAALLGLGIYMVIESLKEEKGELDLSTGWGLFIAAISISLDSLGVGFTLPYFGVPIVVSLAMIFGVSLLSTGCGLWLGRLIGDRAGGLAGIVAGIILALTGIGFGVLRYYGI